MKATLRARLAVLLALLALLAAPALPSAAGRGGDGEPGGSLLGRAGPIETRLRLEIEHPRDGTVTGERAGAFVAGRAALHAGELRRFDLVLVLDTSKSVDRMTGSDVDGDGTVGVHGLFGNTDRDDSILAAEVAAAKRLLGSLDPRYARAALVTFAGDPPSRGGVVFGSAGRPSARLEAPLTSDFAAVASSLEGVLERGAAGLTDMAAGLELARRELLGLEGARSEPDPQSEKVVLFFTDGQPTLSHEEAFEVENIREVLRGANRLAADGVRVHSFAIGPEALEGPVAALEMAARTGGSFLPVREPGDLADVVEIADFARIEAIRVRNASSEEEVTNLLTHADGSFGALVPLQPGRNRIEVVARASDGSVARKVVTVQHAPDAPEGVELLRELVPQRNRLLEQRLLELRRERSDMERRRAEQVRRALELEIDRERARARRRAARQRKELELDVERPPAAGR